ncbi:TPA: AAA family ATPase [Klebsiella quasipneumoniae]|uniref:AAA family ATPase n=1 Tax=Klebsiella pneumoniae complex TaxID=3390273 RepID=UPI002FF8516C|nr:AAA family ATPase [Klebsiella quasipneumoniae subsp. similipneumoniae]HCL5992295.1 AAA family ATPase [Klebsiella pneumoniae]HCM7650360.1 AAA family ATPase [Klebsiella quasipneumoniae]
MKLESFRVRNFRSVFDSGLITTEKLTAILGRNESGKTNLLLALKSLNPAEGFGKLNDIKDFPRNRKLSECTPDTPVVDTTWKLTEQELAELSAIYPRARNITYVDISRRYNGKIRHINFSGLEKLTYDEQKIKKEVRKIKAQIDLFFDNVENKTEQTQPDIQAISDICNALLPIPDRPIDWSEQAKGKPQKLRQFLVKYDIELKSESDDALDELEDTLNEISNDSSRSKQAREWILTKLPVFVMVDEYPELNGHHQMAEYTYHKQQGTLTNADIHFEKLCKVAGISPDELTANRNNSEVRNQLVNRAGAVVTTEIRRLWQDKPLKIRFNVDSDYFDTYVSDTNHTYDVEVNLDERSRGFKWFFSFYITFFADTKGGTAENAVILLDEPGLYLHAKSQADLLNHLTNDFDNQIIYTTHSPFLVPIKNISDVKTVSIAEDKGTTVTNDPSGDSTTLFPLQAALGYDIAQSLFIGSHNLIVEGVTDFWYLSTISDVLTSAGRKGLNSKIIITPAGGAQRVSYMVSLLSSQNLNVVVLLDDEKQSRETSVELQQQGMLNRKNVVFVSDALESKRDECDIEDLFNRDTFLQLVDESYDLKPGTLKLNEKIPRIVKQIENSFSTDKKHFVKAKPARAFMNRLKDGDIQLLSTEELDRFEKLCDLINKRMTARS